MENIKKKKKNKIFFKKKVWVKNGGEKGGI